MDRSTDWPWSWEEEVEWKADLEERDDDFVRELIENAVEDGTKDPRIFLGSTPEESTEDVTSEEYFVTA